MITKPHLLTQKHEQDYEFINEFNEEMEDIDDFENFEQFLKNFKNKSKSENGKNPLKIPENPKDFLKKNGLLKQKPLHKKSKTGNLKNFAIDDTFL